ncbi:DUF4386 domain-containing protein [Kitasatospora viridis]|uniref:DUF4386 domain-containing protein n=1 Tax=Kitasatospora viridis TaxID=281105 RepID=A0A561SF71_9ACTN|nr:DUF4386 domain-containing protein [Kitasatospora viridis]TWF73524.1 hypothetical protein FHX73_15136 [Kitasatospora viridis]
MSATSATPPTTRTGRRPQPGPPLLLPATSLALLTVAYTVVNRATPHPDAPASAVLQYAEQHGGTMRLGAFLLLAAAMPVLLLSAVLNQRLRLLGVTGPGAAIALVGGVLAGGALSLSAATAWAGSRLAADSPPALARALANLSFVSGGPVFAAGFGLLAAGISVSALKTGLLPRALAWSGVLVTALGLLGLLALLVGGFGYLLPAVRFGGLVWLLLAAWKLPRTRRRTNA